MSSGIKRKTAAGAKIPLGSFMLSFVLFPICRLAILPTAEIAVSLMIGLWAVFAAGLFRFCSGLKFRQELKR